MAVSIVIPTYNEKESLQALHSALTDVLIKTDSTYEIIFVDDGSNDDSVVVLEELSRMDAHLRVISLRRNFGKSAALAAGFDTARGEIIVTMDSDLQDDPREIPDMIKMLENYDLVSGWKQKRRDPISKVWPSRLYNSVTSIVTGIKIHDFNCGFKAYRREVVEQLELHGELHRFIPVLAARQGFSIGEKAVIHHRRRFGTSKFGAERFLNGFLDLLTVMFMSSHQRSPLHVFGRMGVAFLGIGVLINIYMACIWIIEHSLRVRPLLLFGVVLIILGIQFVTMGLLGEMIAGLQRERPYRVRKRIPPEDVKDN
ncbi:MAG: glycosyltransferase family 2 protein [Candidatus Eisenbacteria bacterium]|uniref:Glycosyltransferase family 2 protein n=1 Tax=Eiseniibacteriota bacterium TaxID=2212470 RepID=A0A948W8S1_UNCEI|nr:glycosyltransferase family 2 protein [Candidatus Eisenbacteria bacterium]MBU1950398.1 glycosyltransferase family 2 protein [Candidatus Eisenbacteria bacterium]MBU2692981.1 glycosyltransferase family 2 protein [Candidatus Eisenbacteria bacterium]